MISYSNRKLYLCSRFFNRQQALMEIFWNTIAQYNEGTWQAQFIITLAGIALTLLLYRKPTLWVKRSMKIYMVFLNGWISTVYYLMYCGTRNYHHILAIFWGVIALI